MMGATHLCSGRRRYATQAAAESVIFAVRARGGDGSDRLEVRACPHCNGFHLKRKSTPQHQPGRVLAYDPDAAPRGRGRPPRAASLPYKDDD